MVTFFTSISGIKFCGNLGRIYAIVLTSVVWVILIASIAAQSYLLLKTDFATLLLSPFEGDESYAFVLRGKLTKTMLTLSFE